MHHWTAEVYILNSGEEHVKLRGELDDRFTGYLTTSSADVEIPDHGIPRPSWFKPGELSLSDVMIAGAAAKGVMK